MVKIYGEKDQLEGTFKSELVRCPLRTINQIFVPIQPSEETPPFLFILSRT